MPVITRAAHFGIMYLPAGFSLLHKINSWQNDFHFHVGTKQLIWRHGSWNLQHIQALNSFSVAFRTKV